MPTPDPLFWIRPDELSGYRNGQLIPLWQDASQYGNDVAGSAVATLPTAEAPAGVVTDALFGVANGLQAAVAIQLASDFAVYVVANVYGQFLLTVRLSCIFDAFPTTQLALGVEPAQFVYLTPSVSAFVPATVPFGLTQLYSVRRLGNLLVFRLNGSPLPAVIVPVVEPISSVNLTPSFPVHVGPGQSQLFEVRVYSGTVSDVQDLAVTTSLLSRYGIAP